MRTFRSLRKHNGMTRVAVLLIAAVLAVAAAACDGSHAYELTISSTAGGSVTLPGEGTFTYDSGTVVELLAIADDGYMFQVWTGDTEDIADPDSHATNITMNGDYSITADFGGGGTRGPRMP